MMEQSVLGNVRRLLAERRSGHTLPQPLYVDPQVFDFDLQAIFHRCWLLGGLETQIPRSGDYLTLQVGESPLLLIRNTDGGVSGFFNTCRHRGAQICREQRGHARRLVCPYHQWTYDLRGQLLQAGRMHAGFDCSAYSLRPVRVETIAGLIYFCLSDTPPDFSAFRAALAPMLEPHELHNAKVAHTAVLVERANWKLAMENARECYHCRAGHPQLMRSYSDFTGAELTGRTAAWLAAFNARCESHGLASSEVIGSWFEVGRYPLADGVVSYTMDGRQAVAKKLGRVGDGDVGTLWWAAQPNAFHHVVGDYAFFFQALPTGPQQTTVTAKWIVHKDAIEGVDYDLSRLTEVWDATNTQDRALAEYNQCGVNSAAYVPGPYSGLTEQLLIRFVDWYCAEAEAFLDSKAATGLSVS